MDMTGDCVNSNQDEILLEGDLLNKNKYLTQAKEHIENASRLLRRRVPCTGHLMTPRRLWLNKIPTQQCDVVVEFPVGAPEEALLWLLDRLKGAPPAGPGLTVHVRKHETTQCTAFYLSAAMPVLIRTAEECRLPKTLKPELGGGLREFSAREITCYRQDGECLFTSQERQWLILQILQAMRVEPLEREPLPGLSLPEGQSILAGWQKAGIILQVFPLHESDALGKLQATWVRDVLAPQPLDDICSYFGVKVGLYFAWLGHYTMALCVPALVGSLLWLGLLGCGQTAQDIGYVLFSLFNVIWASLYLEAWRRYSVQLAFRWGTLGTPPDLIEPPRPMFTGPLEPSPVTGRLEPAETPAWQRRLFRCAISAPLIGLSLAAVFVVMTLMLHFQDWWDMQVTSRGLWSCLGVLPKVLLAAAITLMDEAYFKMAVWLNDQENHRLESKYENHLIAKVALFQFVNSFLSLFYIAFYLQDQEKLREQLAGLLIARQVIGNVRESAWPYLQEQWRLAKLSFQLWGALSPSEASRPLIDSVGEEQETNQQQPPRSIGQAELESSLCKYEGTFYDHLEMLVQMGYVVLFSSAFPLAALCALLNNLLEIRSDAFKLAHVHQRPFGQRVANIGTWQSAMGLLGLVAVLVNCALIGLSGPVTRLMPGLTASQTILLIVTLEHLMLGLRFALNWLLPELPAWLAAEIARAEHVRREAARKGSSPKSTPPGTGPLLGGVSPTLEGQEKLIGRFLISASQSEAEDYELESALLKDHIGSSAQTVTITTESPPIRATPTPPATPTHPPRLSAEIMAAKIAEIPPYKPRKSAEWISEDQTQDPSLGHHLTIGPGGGAEWARRLRGEGSNVHRSTECIPGKPTELAASSDSDLSRGFPWTSGSVSPKYSQAGSVPSVKTPTGVLPPLLSMAVPAAPSTSVSSDEDATAAQKKAEESAAKKSRVKQSLVKRARSVAIFSLKLKERRAREAEKNAAEQAKVKTPPLPPPQMGGGELSCIPIEKLIQVDDVVRRRNNSGAGML